KDLFHARHVIFALSQMRLEIVLELRITCFLDHLGQRLHDLLFRVIDVAQRVQEQIIHCLDVFREEAHAFLLVFWVSSGCDSMQRRLRRICSRWATCKAAAGSGRLDRALTARRFGTCRLSFGTCRLKCEWRTAGSAIVPGDETPATLIAMLPQN